MDNYHIMEESTYEEPFIQLSSVYNPNNIITLGDLAGHRQIPSLKDLCKSYLKDYICKQDCTVCTLIFLDLPQTLEQELLDLIPFSLDLVSH